ncbi:RlmE family RNA methyltransferase [Nanoarchaeota archaeon]
MIQKTPKKIFRKKIVKKKVAKPISRSKPFNKKKKKKFIKKTPNKDAYQIKAKQEGYRARSSFKLLQLNKRYHIIKKGDVVIDLGCAPGGWIQASLKLGARKVFGIDIQPIRPFKEQNVYFLCKDIKDKNTTILVSAMLHQKADVILSDMAPNTTGIKHLDQEKSLDLCKIALDFTKTNLKKGGNFICKIFQGPNSDEFLKKCKEQFLEVKTTKPEASKKGSKEIFIIALGFGEKKLERLKLTS